MLRYYMFSSTLHLWVMLTVLSIRHARVMLRYCLFSWIFLHSCVMLRYRMFSWTLHSCVMLRYCMFSGTFALKRHATLLFVLLNFATQASCRTLLYVLLNMRHSTLLYVLVDFALMRHAPLLYVLLNCLLRYCVFSWTLHSWVILRTPPWHNMCSCGAGVQAYSVQILNGSWKIWMRCSDQERANNMWRQMCFKLARTPKDGSFV